MENMFNNIGKIPPQAVDVEMAVLGAILLENNAITEIISVFKPEYFYNIAHSKIAEAVLVLFNKNITIDYLTLKDELSKRGTLEEVGGVYYLVELTNRIAQAINIKEHFTIVIEKYLLRTIATLGNELFNKSFNDETDPFDLLDSAINDLDNLRTNINPNRIENFNSILTNYVKKVEYRTELYKDGKFAGIITPLNKLTNITNGWQDTDLIIVAARPSMGKTAFMLETIISACTQKKNVLVFSLEMSKAQLLDRIVQNKEMLQREVVKGDMTDDSWKRFHSVLNVLSNWNLNIDDTGGIGLNHIKAEARKLKIKNEIDLICIDYLQLMDTNSLKSQNRHLQLGEITKGLKALAKEISIPIILLSQLNRGVEQRPNKRPMLSDLRESGSIEEDADVVMFLYRPAYYNILEDEGGESTVNVIEIIVKKNRNGVSNFIIKAKHNETITKIYDDDDTTVTYTYHKNTYESTKEQEDIF